ncbi:ATP-binding cassette domain-containing protein [Candidatus Saccharibacteria bacterium]|nr:ATP-binding cassette domain-containing protein [Candidatus Saccharibacteria bacterium]MBQ3436486.1 ATP-binding cassette domain-containing protein [Candidatus Saccharibacteria bacterium]
MLELKSISYEVKGGSRAKILDQISLTIKPGTLTIITGPNGSGKSTLADVIMGIKPATSGRIVLDKEDVTDLDITTRAKKGLAYAFQQPVHLKGINAYDLINIASGELISPEDATKILKKVGLSSEYLSREISDKLSGGELKRIEIASVLAKNARIIIFDEPEAGIDLWSFDNLIKIFKKLKSDGVTTIIISHQERILKLADEIIILEKGKIKKKGAPAKILSNLAGGAYAVN